MLKYKTKFMTLFLFLFLFSCTNIDSKPINENPIIKIKNNYAFIEQNLKKFKELKYNDIGLYKEIDKKYSIEIDELGEVAMINMFKYYQKMSIQKIVIDFENSLKTAKSHYYYQENKLFFVHKIVYEFKTHKYHNDFDKNKYSKHENRFYFYNNKMIKWIKDNKEINFISKKWQALSKKTIYDSNVYLEFKGASN